MNFKKAKRKWFNKRVWSWTFFDNYKDIWCEWKCGRIQIICDTRNAEYEQKLYQVVRNGFFEARKQMLSGFGKLVWDKKI